MVEELRQRLQDILQLWRQEWKEVKIIESKSCPPVRVSRIKMTDSPLQLIRGDGVVHATMQEMSDFFMDFGNMGVMDKMFLPEKARGMIQTFDARTHVYHAAFKLPFPMTDRDFVWLAYDDVVDQTGNPTPTGNTVDKIGVSIGWSIEHPSVPENSSFIRGSINVSGYIWTPGVEAGTCNLSYIVQCDPHGWIPKWVVNLVAADQAENVKRVQKYFKQRQSLYSTNY
eukprot:gnl/Hemi2/21048_TR6989_c0_g1_i1.p1 gnl/Hemi2/21048_TR6989_c0_g1~~gnl/Hemi2/21048_TR6989_c0_g1_i1.p1  ORF type:complete len:227 (+),score=51.33 gnl/Hemi2/21048_TR6989_c0_g1_i1:88-768(+)